MVVRRKDTHDGPGLGLVSSSTTMIFRGLFFLFFSDVEMCVQNLIKYKYDIFLTVLKDVP